MTSQPPVLAYSKETRYPYFGVLAKKTTKNQITLPKAIVEKLPDTDYFEVSLRGEEIVLRPVLIEGSGSRLRRVRKKIAELGLTEKDIDEAIHWARGR